MRNRAGFRLLSAAVACKKSDIEFKRISQPFIERSVSTLREQENKLINVQMQGS